MRSPDVASGAGPTAAADTLREQQHRLAAHVRDPAQAPPPDLDERRLQVYRDLFFNGLQGLLAGHFPVIRKILGTERWRDLVRAFYREHRSTTPLFPEVPRAELALDFSEADPANVPHDPDGDLLDGVPVPSPLAWALAYAWPVHRLSPTYLPDTAPPLPTCLLLHRGALGRVRFDEINALTFRLLQRLADGPPASGRSHLRALAAEAGADDADALVADGAAMLRKLRAEGVLLGSAPP
jgi:hypothetical protein